MLYVCNYEELRNYFLHYKNFDIDEDLEVETWWDLGMNDSTVITFAQRHGSEIRIIDCYENSGEGLKIVTL